MKRHPWLITTLAATFLAASISAQASVTVRIKDIVRFAGLTPVEVVGYGVVIGAATYLAFSAAGRIARVLGQTGINVMVRLMGLILAAMAVELLADGLGVLFPVLTTRGH